MSGPATFSSAGAQCPKCGHVTEDDDAWIAKHGEQDVNFTCEGCGASLAICASFTIDYTTRIREGVVPVKAAPAKSDAHLGAREPAGADGGGR